MRPHDAVTEFGATIARELCFDPRLARRVRAEAEDHLLAALGRSADPPSRAAQLEAIRAFGDPQDLARAFMPGAVQALARRAAVLMALAVIGIFAAMRARSAWYGLMHSQVSDQLRTASTIGVPADRLAFAMAFVFALAALVYAMTRRPPPRLHAAFGREIGRCVALCAIAILSLFAAITTEIVLTGIRFMESDVDASALVAAFSLALEIAAAAGCTAHLVLTLRRLSLALRLAGDN